MRSSLVIVAIGIALMAGPVNAGQTPAAPKPAPPAGAPAAQTPPAAAARRRSRAAASVPGRRQDRLRERPAHRLGVDRGPGRDQAPDLAPRGEGKGPRRAQREVRGGAQAARDQRLGAERVGPRRRSRRTSSGCRPTSSAPPRTPRRRSRTCRTSCSSSSSASSCRCSPRCRRPRACTWSSAASIRAWSGPIPASTSPPTSSRSSTPPPRPRRRSSRLRRAGRVARSGPVSSGARRPPLGATLSARSRVPVPTITPLALDRLSYRYPVPLVDAVVAHERGRALEAVKSVTVSEDFFQGHFPGPAGDAGRADARVAGPGRGDPAVRSRRRAARDAAPRCAASTASSSAARSCPATGVRLAVRADRRARPDRPRRRPGAASTIRSSPRPTLVMALERDGIDDPPDRQRRPGAR